MNEVRTSHSTNHRSGKLVVLSIFAFGLLLGLIGLKYRASMPKGVPVPPSTRPATAPATAPASQPA